MKGRGPRLHPPPQPAGEEMAVGGGGGGDGQEGLQKRADL